MLSLAILAAAAVAALVVYAAARTIQQYLALKQFQGPTIAGFTRLWLLKANSSGEMHKAFTDINNQYGESHLVINCRPFFPLFAYGMTFLASTRI